MKNNKKEKILKLLSTIKPYLINTLLALVIFFIALYVNNIAPFGEYTIAKNDSFNQYEPMLFNFIKNIQNGSLTLYSFLNGLGNSTFFNFVYYLSSPINLFATFFKSANSMFLAIITIKLVIAIITSTFYAKKKTNNNFITTIISLSYAFSAWFLTYNQTIMWLDSFIIFPIFQYGLEQLIKESKPYIYIFSLSYIMISNFYIAWMICLYTLVFFIYQTIFTKKSFKEKINNFNTIAISTIIVMLLSFFYIYITYDSFMSIGLYINRVSDDYTSLTILNMIKSFFTGNTIISLTAYDEVFPNIAMSMIFTISLLYYFINNKINKKERLKNLMVFIFIIILLYSKTLNYIMNCFHVPIGYCFRYSFLISFYMIHLFIQNYKNFDHKIDKKIFFILAILVILLIIEIVFKNIETKIFLLNLITLIITTILLILYKNKNIYRYIYTAFIILEILTSAILNINSKMPAIDKNFTYNKEKTTYREIIKNNEQSYIDINLNLYENKNTIRYFSSMQYNKVLFDLQDLGCNTDNKALIELCPNTEIFNTLLNVKTNNEYHLEKIYAVNQSIQGISLNSTDYFENQNLLLKTMTNTENDIIKTVELKPIKNFNNKYKVTKSGTYYIKLKGIYQIITINNVAYTYDKELVKDDNLEVQQINEQLELKLVLEKNDTIEITYPSTEDIENTLTVYYFDEEEFIKKYQLLKDHQITYSLYKESIIEGTINVAEEQIIFTSIPYDKNWKITIDGKEANKVLILNSLLGIECKPGTHKIKLEYKTNYTIPCIISVTTLISLIIKIIIDIRKQKKNN